MEENKLKTFFKKMGLRFMSTFSNQSIEELEKETEALEIIDKTKEDSLKLIEKLETETLSSEEIDDILKSYGDMKQRLRNKLNKILTSDEIKDKNKIRVIRDDMFKELDGKINQAKETAMSKIKEEKIKEPEVPEESEGINPILTYDVEPKKVQVMPEVKEDAPTALPTQEPTIESEETPITEEKEEPEFEKNDSEEVKGEINSVEEKTEESEVDNEIQEPVISEGIDITDEITSKSIQDIDLSQCSDWYDYVATYFVKSGIDIKDVHRFYKDIYNGNYPSDFLDEKTFAIEKQRLEDEKEYRKLEAERAEAEKRLREIKVKQDAISEKNAELKAELKVRVAKLDSFRRDNVSLQQQLVDKDGQIKNNNQEIKGLQGQLNSAQEVAKKAQAQSYKDRKALSDIEKELQKEKMHAKELEQMLRKSEKEASETKRELEATKARISENAKVALERIESLRAEDELEKTALDWGKSKLEKDIENNNIEKKTIAESDEQKRKPKHLAKPTTEEKEAIVETKTEEKKEESTFDIPTPIEMPQPEINLAKEISTNEPQVIGISATPDPELQGVVRQDSNGRIDVDFGPLEDKLKAERENLEATREDLVNAIKEEAGENTNSEIKTR